MLLTYEITDEMMQTSIFEDEKHFVSNFEIESQSEITQRRQLHI